MVRQGLWITMREVGTNQRRQKAVYWPKTGNDFNGRPTFGDPEEIDVKWEDGKRTFRQPNGDPVQANTTVYVGQDVTLGSQLWLGELEDLPTKPDKRNVVFFESISHISGGSVQRTAYTD